MTRLRLIAAHPETATMPDPNEGPSVGVRVTVALCVLASVILWLGTASHVAGAVLP